MVPSRICGLEAIVAGKATVDSWQAIGPFYHGRWDEAARAHRAAEKGQKNIEAAKVFAADGAFDPDAIRTALARFTSPALLLAGEVDLAAPPRAMAEFAAPFPHADLVIQRGAGHFPWLDDAEQFVARSRTFLAEATTCRRTLSH